MKLSVIICTHNPRKDYLSRVLEALKAQSLDRSQWELLLIDNASKEPLSSQWDLSWHPNSKHVSEPNPGLTRARKAGIQASSTPLLCFVDDDNVLAPDYLELSVEIAQSWPMLGAWGGQLPAEFDAGFTPSSRAKKRWHAPLDRDFWGNIPVRTLCPVGGGMVIRKCVVDAYLQKLKEDARRVELDRKGNSLVSGGDIDMAYCACDMGLGIALFHKLTITHLIGESRCNDAYLDRLVEGFGYSRTMLNYIRNGTVPRRQNVLRKALNWIRQKRMNADQARDARCTANGIEKAIRDIQKSAPIGHI
jgi:glycosyltransferase involved in cell wall biosynthesis